MTLPQAVLLDRDGTLIEDRHYLSDPEGVVLLPGVGEGLARLAAAGCRLFLVSNQSGVGRGYFSEDAVRSCQERLESLLRPYGVLFEDAVWCPHAPAEDCRCRKPLPGLWERLRDRHGLDPRHCLMAGDKMDDLLFAVNAGLATGLLVLTGKGKDQALRAGLPVPETGCVALDSVSGPLGPVHRALASDFGAATDWILSGRSLSPVDRPMPEDV